MNKKLLLFFLPLISIIIILKLNQESKLEKKIYLFGTRVDITIFDKDKKKMEYSINKALEELKRIEKKYNSRTSESMYTNYNNGKSITIDSEGKEMLQKVLEFCKLTDGSYDITIFPLVNTWGFTKEKFNLKNIPTKSEIANALSLVDYRKIKIKDNTLKAVKDINVDTSSFIKGYAISKAKKVLEENNIEHGFISSNSSIEVIGSKPNRKRWKFAIPTPGNLNKILETIYLNNEALGVSGIYQTFKTVNGKKYHHLLNAKTGYPIDDKILLAVVSKNAFIADLYSTALFTLPIEKVIEIANKNNLAVLILNKNNELVLSDKYIKRKE